MKKELYKTDEYEIHYCDREIIFIKNEKPIYFDTRDLISMCDLVDLMINLGFDKETRDAILDDSHECVDRDIFYERYHKNI